MTNHLAIILAVIIAVSIIADINQTGGDNLLFLAKKMESLIEWMAFWR